jgi:hypothetical protein
MKKYGVVKVQLHILTSAIDGGERLASRTGRFTPRERVPVTHWIGGWVDLRVGLDTAVPKRKILSPTGNRTPVIQPVAYKILMPYRCVVKAVSVNSGDHNVGYK